MSLIIFISHVQGGVSHAPSVQSASTSGERYSRPSTETAICGQSGVVVITSTPSLKETQVSSVFVPVMDGFQANACPGWTVSALDGCATQSRVRYPHAPP